MRVLLANELGHGTGHLHTAATLGALLSQRGHEVQAAVRDLVAAQGNDQLSGRPLLQAPVPAPRAVAPGRLAADHADLLLQAGYGDRDAATGLLAAWDGLLNATGATAVIAEHAPLALLAARARGLPAVALGTGFTVPPGISPLPALRPSERHSASAEETITASFSTALERLGAPALRSLAELYPAERSHLLSLPEFDHYGLREGDACAGILAPADSDVRPAPAFPEGDGPRTILYRHPGYGGFDAVVACLAATAWPTVVVAPGIDPARAAALGGPRLRVTGQQVDLAAALEGADQVVVHGGHGTTSRTVLAGLPCLVLPYFLEQALLGERLQAAGLAAVRTRLATPGELEHAFAELDAPDQRRARAEFRDAYADTKGLADPEALAAWLEARLGEDARQD